MNGGRGGVLRYTNALDVFEFCKGRLHLRYGHGPRSFTSDILFLNVEDITTFFVIECYSCTILGTCYLRPLRLFFGWPDFLVVELKIAI